MKVSEELVVSATPEECLNSAARYMVELGYDVSYRDASTVVLRKVPGPNDSYYVALQFVIILALAVITLGLALLLFLVRKKPTWTASVVAVPAEGRTHLTLSGSHRKVRSQLKRWVKASPYQELLSA